MNRFANLIRLEALEDYWFDCQSCELGKTRKRLVMWRGSPNAKLFLIGEGPGADEDEKGFPFVGAAGRKLDDMLREAQLDPSEDVFITNMVGCRPPNNRVPERSEIKACSGRLQGLLHIVDPKVIVLLGGTAASLAGIKTISKWRGEQVDVDVLMWNGETKSWPSIPTYHPSYLLRTGNNAKIRQQIVGDLKLAKKVAHVQ